MIVGLLIGVGFLVLLGFVWILIYNSLIKLKNYIEEAWSQVDVQLQRRYDLIPNLVSVVKGYADFERVTLQKVIEARNILSQSSQLTREQTVEQNDMLTNSLKSLFAVSEDYPELKANESFMHLQEELTATENKISYARQLYNTSVVTYNIKIQSIPTNIIAAVHNFKKAEVLKTAEEERKNVRIEF